MASMKDSESPYYMMRVEADDIKYCLWKRGDDQLGYVKADHVASRVYLGRIFDGRT